MLSAGQTLYDRYQLQEKLGHGAGRQTWLAIDLSAKSEPVIVKLLAFGEQSQWDDLKLFERESQILRQLDHPRIPKCRDSFSIDDRILWFGLVQDYIPGTSLKQLIQDGKRFSEEEVRKIAIEILTILRDLHSLNPAVLHRDIKPSNLILGADQQIYLVDFGAVQDRASVEGATFTVVGTYGYTPIEQFGGRAVASSDLYALGATLIHLLTGASPADLPQRYLRIQWRDRVTLSPALADWIDQLSHPDLEQRFQSAIQAMDRLNLANTVSYAPVERPKNTRIQLSRSKKRLEIVIPKQTQEDESRLEILGLLAALPVLMFVAPMLLFVSIVGVLSSASWILLLGLIVFVMFISPSFQRTYVKFDRREFIVETQRFKTTSNRMTGITRDIREVRRDSNGLITITSGPYRTGYRLHQFGQELTDFEQAWVLKEIRSWLKLKSEI
ncbi:MAG: serine/threonine protein kinase [Plectolyngbya sp. WJT66-NPBG17]|jgi:serine/threonine protein kinase|nr:serine/threonine protein kinase [Plectolyngbya sp. WJT66-NPBG17]MBW4523836.1 serine/threonine protein kinase [Phormidium tanganyikae FI6-MK23]